MRVAWAIAEADRAVAPEKTRTVPETWFKNLAAVLVCVCDVHS